LVCGSIAHLIRSKRHFVLIVAIDKAMQIVVERFGRALIGYVDS
jgi:hypothetical protein